MQTLGKLTTFVFIHSQSAKSQFMLLGIHISLLVGTYEANYLCKLVINFYNKKFHCESLSVFSRCIESLL